MIIVVDRVLNFVPDFYDKVIRCINQREHSVEESRGSQVIVSKVGSLHCSYSMESHKLDMHSNSTGSNDLVMDGMNKNLTVQSKSSASDSNNDVPCDLSISSADRRNINRRAHSIEELLCPEVIMTDVGSSQGTSTSEALRRVEEMNNTSNFQDWMFCRISSFLYAYQNSVTSPNDSDNKWTLKHKGPLPGLVELWPNSGVYIRDLELKYCLRYAKKGTQLSRFLTKHIFSELALRSCWSINDKYDRRFNLYGGRHFGLYGGAITAIVNFVQTYGKTQNWRPQSEKSIKSAVRYQLSLFKKTT